MTDQSSYNSDELREATADDQLAVMEAWFRERFEDPAERTPYESREGGYIWIWGGPYDAESELLQEFEGIVPLRVIKELVDSLASECQEWAPTAQASDYDEGLFQAVSENAAADETLDNSLSIIETLLRVSVPEGASEAYRRLLYANAIAALETFLSDTFINRVFSDSNLLETYVDGEPKFSERKVLYKDILREAEKVADEARKELLDMVWHNLAKVRVMYAQVLKVNIGDLSVIGPAVQARHDIVHRNGRRKDGTLVSISSDDIRDLVSAIKSLATRVALKLDYDFDVETSDKATF